MRVLRSFAPLSFLYQKGNIRLFHFDHNPQATATFVVDDTVVVAPWQTAAVANQGGSKAKPSVLDGFSAACYYFGESLTVTNNHNNDPLH